jgi:hypothetical protein
LGTAAVTAAAQQPPAYQLHRDVIRGRVTTDSGVAIAGAEIAVTMAPDRNTQFATSDSGGRYEVVFERGTGDYLVHVAAPTRLAFRKRVTRTGADSVFTVDAVLKPAVQQLAAVQVQARRQRPARDGGSMGLSVGAAEQVSNGVNGRIAPDQAGNLDAIASSMPGVTATPGGGISVLGLPPSQNSTMLNGLAFGGGSVPRGASTNTRVATSMYDPARGGFSGALTQITLSPGGQYTQRRGYLTLDAPQMQSADVVARRSGAKYGALDLNVGTEGSTNFDRWVYNGGLEYKRQAADAVSLTDADVDVLEHAGVARDSVTRLFGALNALGIPLDGASVPSSRITDHVGFLGRLDRPLFDYSTFTPKNTTWGLTGFADYTRRGALSFGPTATPAHGGESTQLNAGGQFIYSAYFGKLKDELTDFHTGVSVSRSTNSPYLRLPDGRVLVSSRFDDGTGGIASLSFAGNSLLESSRRTVTWQTTNETQFYWKGHAAHKGKVYAESRLDGFSQDPASDRLGSFTFNSLADLQANRPAAFSRTLFTPSRTGGEWSGALAASDQWTRSPTFSLLYGARLEGNVYTSTPAYNPQIETLFGERTDRAPDTWHVSPRIGFNWLSTTKSRAPNTSVTMSNIGTYYSLPRGVLRGGFGEFRQSLDPALLSDATASTGLPNSVRRLTCVGSAVPVPDWSAYAGSESAIPTQCVGVPTSGFADVAPAVQLFDRDYQPARAWRGNLAWGSTIKGISYTLDAAYSLNVDQPSTVDLNFSGTSRFALANEGGRPVFVPAGSIVPSTGAVSAVAARRSPSFGPVLSRTSDLRGWARQLSVRARPTAFLIGGHWVIDGVYTFTQARSQSRGFDGAAFGDPAAIIWARGDFTPTHEFTLQAALQTKWMWMTVAGKVSSGLPYTPVVGSDVNGDGLANDRAFVFAPGAGADPATVSALDRLIASTSGNARRCLQRQRGGVAGRNSCEGPWSSTVNATIAPSFGVMRSLRKYHVQSMSLYLANPLGGLDQLLHGDNLHGWGSPAFPDRVLYYVRGFDSTAHSYRYDVNPRFGDTRPSATSLRVPFRVTLDVSMDFSRGIDEQQLDRILAPGRRGSGVKLDSAAIVRRYCGNLPNWYNEIFAQSDSLLLTRDQVDALRAAQATYNGRIVAHWGTWAEALATLPDHYDVADLVKRQTKLVDDAWEIARQEARTTLPKVLTPVQLKLLPGNSSFIYRAEKPITNIRFFSTAGCTG